MRLILAAALLVTPLAVLAQETPPGTDVERVTLAPGQSASFTLAQGYSHQLLRAAAPTAKGAITVRYQVSGGHATLVATSHTGYPTKFDVLADPDGTGGFKPAGDVALPGDGSVVTQDWPGTLGTINIGNFQGGPQGGAPH